MKRFYRGIVIVFVVALIVLNMNIIIPAQAADTFDKVKVAKFWIGENFYVTNANKIDIDVSPYINDAGRTMVPLRFLSNSLGIPEDKVVWDDKTSSVNISSGNTKLIFTVNKKLYEIKVGTQSTQKSMDTIPEFKNDRVFLPARYVAEALGYDVMWNEKASAVTMVPQGEKFGPLKKYNLSKEEFEYDWTIPYEKPEVVRIIENVLGVKMAYTGGPTWVDTHGERNNWAVEYAMDKYGKESIRFMFYPRVTGYNLTDVDMGNYKPIAIAYFPRDADEIIDKMREYYYMVKGGSPDSLPYYNVIVYEKGDRYKAPYVNIVNWPGNRKEWGEEVIHMQIQD